MRVPPFGQWLMELAQRIFPSSKIWQSVIATIFIAGGFFFAYAKITARIQ